MSATSIDMLHYGYRPNGNETPELNGQIPARITEVHKELYKIICTHGESPARLKGTFLHECQQNGDFPAVGDFVRIQHNPQGDALITALLPRRSKFSRPDFWGHKVGYAKTILEQVVAANFDFVFILTSLNQDFSVPRVERYVTAAWQSGGTPVVILTKADLCNDAEAQIRAIQRNAPGVDVLAVSAQTGAGLDRLLPYLQPGKTLVFLGMSGVGKSSLVNALAGQEVMPVQEIREDDSRGRHTTTHRQLLMLPQGVLVIDTPGMRELGLWAVDDGLDETFADVLELLGRCRFSDCQHKNEPGCAIRTAIECGQLDPNRFKRYLALEKEAKYTNDKAAFMQARAEKNKSISRYTRALKESEKHSN